MNRAARRATIHATARFIVQLRGWPGMDGYKAPRPITPYAKRLWERQGLVVFAAASAGALGEFGLGAFLVVNGRSVARRGVIVPDDCAHDVRYAIEDRAADYPTATTTGASGWEVITLSEFSDPRHGVFSTTSYTGAGFTIGADLGSTGA